MSDIKSRLDTDVPHLGATPKGRCKQVLTGIGAHIVNYFAHPYIVPIELASDILNKIDIFKHYRGLCAQFCFDQIVNTFSSMAHFAAQTWESFINNFTNVDSMFRQQR
ncbi:hypothetical protein TI39_contig530g00006 [Zymoseptoria brevis]|uniref:Uncharacterized protein n=1 Tax=Zymoseptoria brevis TaxID=1047168 RepID=A0A0F4GIK1_9PEZI|nr:hypothetical protein TI39_contig530g00006 [Zymoseptoria brevis]